MSLTRQTIKIEEQFIKDLIEENHVEGFEIIENKQQTHDPDDGNLCIFVVKRLSDGKFFKGDYNWWSDDRSFDDYSRELEQVFLKTKTITTYE